MSETADRLKQSAQTKRELLEHIQALAKKRNVLIDELRVWIDVEAQGIEPNDVETLGVDPKVWPYQYLKTCAAENHKAQQERIRLKEEAKYAGNPLLDESELPPIPHPWYQYCDHQGFLPGYFNFARMKDGTIVPLTPPVRMAVKGATDDRATVPLGGDGRP